jgi:hypothetical protein
MVNPPASAFQYRVVLRAETSAGDGGVVVRLVSVSPLWGAAEIASPGEWP